MAKRPISSHIKWKEYLFVDNPKIVEKIKSQWPMQNLVSNELEWMKNQVDLYYDHVLPVLSIMENVWSVTEKYKTDVIANMIRKMSAITESVDFENILSTMVSEYNDISQRKIISFADLSSWGIMNDISSILPVLVTYNWNKLWADQSIKWEILYTDIGQHTYSKTAILRSSPDGESYIMIDFDRIIWTHKYVISKKLFNMWVREWVIHWSFRAIVWLKNISNLSMPEFEIEQDVIKMDKNQYHNERMRIDPAFKELFLKLKSMIKLANDR